MNHASWLLINCATMSSAILHSCKDHFRIRFTAVIMMACVYTKSTRLHKTGCTNIPSLCHLMQRGWLHVLTHKWSGGSIYPRVSRRAPVPSSTTNSRTTIDAINALQFKECSAQQDNSNVHSYLTLITQLSYFYVCVTYGGSRITRLAISSSWTLQ
jgi:hypothetical protein